MAEPVEPRVDAETAAEPDTTPRRRIRSLDGLRGLAAMVVLLSHVMVVSPRFADPYRGADTQGAAMWLITYTPLHLVWGGTEAVLVFFVLSGYVLALPALAADRPPWLAYYAQRLPRLYLPVWAALVVAVILAVLIDRTDVVGASWWLNEHDPVSTREVAKTAALATEPSFSVDAPLWSLRWEVLFSILLPVFVLVAVALRRQALALTGILLLVVALGAREDNGALMYLPVFGIGVLLAVRKDAVAARAQRASGATWWALFVLCLVLLTAAWTIVGTAGGVAWAVPVGLPLEVLGAAILVVAFAHWQPCVRIGASAVAQRLGQLSFSLYLVHEPVVVATGYLLYPSGGAPLVAVVAVPLALVVAAGFFRLVERPSHLLARRLGARVARA